MSLEAKFNFGSAVEASLIDAVQNWRDEHAANVLMDDVLAHVARSVSVEVTMYPGGVLVIITTVRGRRQWDDETHIFHYARGRENSWRRTRSSIPSS